MDEWRCIVEPPVRDPDFSATFVVGTFNTHAGVDGWGQRFDVVDACRRIGADVLVLEETWTPDVGAGLADEVAAALGYSLHWCPLAGGRRALPHPQAGARWMRSPDWRGSSHAIFLDSERPFGDRIRASARYKEAEPGRWGLAVLSRLPVSRTEVIDLGHLRRDRARRAAVVVVVDAGGTPVTVVGTHMSHITYGAPLHFVQLNRRLRSAVRTECAVLAGDMNLWGPPVAALLPGWRRTLRQSTWPAWRPHSHVDHVLVRGPLSAITAQVLPPAGSDHLPVRVELGVRQSRTAHAPPVVR